MSTSNSAIAYGIDFGTSNTTVSVAREGKIQILEIDPLAKSPFILRSVIYFAPDSKTVLFGEDAIQKYLQDIALGKSSERKQIFTGKYIKVDKPILGASGYRGTEMIPELIEVDVGDAGRLVQSVKSGLGSPYVKELYVYEKVYLLEEIAGLLLKEIKQRADNIVKENVESVVIGRPVNFVGGNNTLAIERLEKAAKMAGFKNIIFEYEPLGASRNYDIDSRSEDICFIFDFGGGTLDFSIVEYPSQKVIINDGIPIGGEAINSNIFTQRLLKYFGGSAKFGDYSQPLPKIISESLKHWYQISLLKTKKFLDTIEDLKAKSDDHNAMDALFTLVNDNLGFYLYEEIDRTKISLSDLKNETLVFNHKNIEIEENITRGDFENLIFNNIVQIDNNIDEVLAKAGLTSDNITTVITTGGSSLIPVVQSLLKRKFKKAALNNQHPFTSVSYGLAKKAILEFGL